MRVLLLLPPMMQVNTPYPSTAYLTGFLRSRGVDCRQADVSMALVSQMFSSAGLAAIRDEILALHGEATARTNANVAHFLDRYTDYAATVDIVMGFLRGGNQALAARIASRRWLPEGPAYGLIDWELVARRFGPLAVRERAAYVAGAYLEQLTYVVGEGVDPDFKFTRYAEELVGRNRSFDPLRDRLESETTLVDRLLEAEAAALLAKHEPDLVGVTLPFPGNVYGAFRLGREVKRLRPQTPVVFGGGWCNTDLRSVDDSRVFDYCDYITFDDGEAPLLALLDHIEGKRTRRQLIRTRYREGAMVQYAAGTSDVAFSKTGTPSYEGLPRAQYFPDNFLALDSFSRLYGSTHWNKLTLAHGCYWRRCTFCDIHLDYVGRYETASADLIVDRIEALIDDTGVNAFHFVDEACPPVLLASMAKRLIERRVEIAWFGNVRFDKAFTPRLAESMARAGCVAVTGGLEVASDRILRLMDKGTTVEQVARVARAFRDAGIFVHAYLMYGFPTQTLQEAVDSLEVVRQLFQERCLDSAFWHRFVCTRHSPIGRQPEKYGLIDRTERLARGRVFTDYGMAIEDPGAPDWRAVGVGLVSALGQYVNGFGYQDPPHAWLPPGTPATTVPPRFIADSLSAREEASSPKAHAAGEVQRAM